MHGKIRMIRYKSDEISNLDKHPLPSWRSIRLPEYDYTQRGAYFVTICVRNKQCFFGTIKNYEMVPNNAGLMITTWYLKLENKFPDIQCDVHMVMPNHFHAIVWISTNTNTDHATTQNPITTSSVPTIVQWFKTMTTNAYIKNVKRHDWPRFSKSLWQRNYYEHVIRDEDDYLRIKEYITTNPAQWESDQEYPF